MSKPVIVQSDSTILLEVNNPDFENARDGIASFAELEKSPEHVHTYRITPLSLWNAAASGLKSAEILRKLALHSRYEIPEIVKTAIIEQMKRYGLLKLVSRAGILFLESEDANLLAEIAQERRASRYIESVQDEKSLKIRKDSRGHIKQALIKMGFPVQDLAGYEDGDPLEFSLKKSTSTGKPLVVRDYQESASQAFHRGGGPEGGSGIVVLPCGAGKTIVGMLVMERLQTETLILVTNTIAIRQWKEELKDKTNLSQESMGEFSGEKKEIRPVTIATYNILTYRKDKNGPFVHFDLFNSKRWGLVVYDEVHLLPAPVFRMSAEIQSRRRLGLTATLVREDGMETDVFSLIGPKKFDMPWKLLEKSGWIAKALCTEIRIDLPEDLRPRYATSGDREKFRVSSENRDKTFVARAIMERHKGASILVIGQYISQLREFADGMKLPIITGSTPVSEREVLYAKFKSGEIKILVVSKVANYSIDLPDANVAIQISGTFGSRQEEAQRLGRILRPKENENQAHFYTIITAGTVEENFAHNRQLFLTEQGYSYMILNQAMFRERFSA